MLREKEKQKENRLIQSTSMNNCYPSFLFLLINYFFSIFTGGRDDKIVIMDKGL